MISLVDFDSSNLETATIQITSYYSFGEDELSFVDQNGMTGFWDAGSGTLTLSGTASVADYEAALRSITYSNSSESPSTDTRVVSWIVSDVKYSSYTRESHIQVAAVNDNPTAVADNAIAVETGGVSNGTSGSNPNGNVLTNDSDVDIGDTMTVSGVSAGIVGNVSGSVASNVTGAYGSITIQANGDYTYTVDNSNSTVQALRTSSNTITDVFTYTMRDAGGWTSTTQITITIQGANDAPTNISAGTLTIDENSANSSAIGTASGVDIDSDGTDVISYTLDSDAGGRFTINSTTGVVTVNGAIDREATASYNITIRATSADASFTDQVFSIAIVDAKEFSVTTPIDTNPYLDAIQENAANGVSVGVVAFAHDNDGTSSSIVYSLDNNANGRFTIGTWYRIGRMDDARSATFGYDHRRDARMASARRDFGFAKSCGR